MLAGRSPASQCSATVMPRADGSKMGRVTTTRTRARENIHRLLTLEPMSSGILAKKMSAPQRKHIDSLLQELVRSGDVRVETRTRSGVTADFMIWQGEPFNGETRPFGGDGDGNSYPAVHQRLRRTKGRARDHACHDCGQPAQNWSYDRADPNQVEGETKHGRGDRRPYSLSMSHYQPVCYVCHVRRDRAIVRP